MVHIFAENLMRAKSYAAAMQKNTSHIIVESTTLQHVVLLARTFYLLRMSHISKTFYPISSNSTNKLIACQFVVRSLCASLQKLSKLSPTFLTSALYLNWNSRSPWAHISKQYK